MAKAKIQVALAVRCDKWPVPTQRIRKAVRWIAEDYQFESGDISIAVVDDAEIRTLNRTHLNHDWATDAISFVFENDERLEGEIIVSAETAYRMGEKTAWSGAEELLLYVIHGMLHLVGLDDHDEADAMEMRVEEQHYLTRLGIPGAENHLRSFEET